MWAKQNEPISVFLKQDVYTEVYFPTAEFWQNFYQLTLPTTHNCDFKYYISKCKEYPLWLAQRLTRRSGPPISALRETECGNDAWTDGPVHRGPACPQGRALPQRPAPLPLVLLYFAHGGVTNIYSYPLRPSYKCLSSHQPPTTSEWRMWISPNYPPNNDTGSFAFL